MIRTFSTPRLNLTVAATLLALLVSLQPAAAHAKDMSSRLGVGYKNQFSIDLPSVSAQYYPNPDVALAGSLGVESGNNESKFGLMFKVHRVVFPEDHLNFYMGAGAGLLSRKQNNQNESGFELLGFMGCEFFIPGLESMSLSFEAGAGVISISSGVTFRTIGDSPARAGMLFYF